MARQSGKTTKTRAQGRTSQKKGLSPAQKKSQKQQAAKAVSAQQGASRIFDERMRRDIVGVLVALLGVVLFVIVVVPTDAPVSFFISEIIKLIFGVGAFVFPFLLLAVGASFLIRFEKERMPARVAIGFTMIFLALSVILSLFTPLVPAGDLDALFRAANLVSHGGYLGAGFAWVGLSLLGQPISLVLMFGLIVAALVVVGFSFSRFIEKIQDGRRREDYCDDDTSALDGPGYARIYRASDQDVPEGEATAAAANTRRMDDAEFVDIPPVVVGAVGAVGAPPAPPGSVGRFDRPRRARVALGARLAAEAAEAVVPGEYALQEEEQGRQGQQDRQGQGQQGRQDSLGNRQLTRKLGKRSSEDASTESTSPSRATARKRKAASSGTPRPLQGFTLPPASILVQSKSRKTGVAGAGELRETAACLQETLGDFNVFAKVVDWVAGPTVTLFKVDLPAGVRVSRITVLEDDIALALASPGVRIFAPIPGTNYVGIEVPNLKRESVLLGDVLKDASAGPLELAIGRDVEGHSIISDLAKMPHLLIGGTTGSGKSVSINAMIMSVLMRATPAEVRFILIDPKRVEFSPYNGIPHLYVPVVTEPKEAAGALSWGVAEMERRLKVFSKVGARNIGQYNAMVQAEIEAAVAAAAAEDAAEGATGTAAANIDPATADSATTADSASTVAFATTADSSGLSDRSFGLATDVRKELPREMPYIVIVIDELADLMMNVGKEVEFSISRIAQLARAAGIHLIVATQRPSANVVTGLIKANITNRIAFNVASSIDSRVVLDTPGAENLIGLGDLLLSKPEYAKPLRIQGCYVSESEINQVVEHLRNQGDPDYHPEILKTNLHVPGAFASDGSGGSANDDPLVWEAAEIVVSGGLGSTSNIQRRLKVGYSRAGRIMDMLEEKGIVGPANGSKPREVLVDVLELETLKAFESVDREA